MNPKTNEPVDRGKWGKASWELFLSNELPPANLCTTIACVAIRDLRTLEVVLTFNVEGRKDEETEELVQQWEILGGGIEPGEDIMDALAREAVEEGGFYIAHVHPFAYRRVRTPPEVVHPKTGRPFPPLSYTPLLLATTERPLGVPTDGVPNGTYLPEAMKALTDAGQMDVPELKIVQYGLVEAAALRARGEDYSIHF